MSTPLASDGLHKDGNNYDDKSRKEWRRDCRLRLAQISVEQKALATQAIGARLQQFVTESGAKTLAVYWPIHDEPELLPLWHSLRQEGFQLALPRVVAKGKALSFNIWQSDSPLLLNPWGIAELGVEAPTVPLQDIDLIMMPCVGFWRSGYRLGYGGGFYDRTLAQWRGLPLASERKRIAVALAYIESELPEELVLLETDQRCDAIITPNQNFYSAVVGNSVVLSAT